MAGTAVERDRLYSERTAGYAGIKRKNRSAGLAVSWSVALIQEMKVQRGVLMRSGGCGQPAP